MSQNGQNGTLVHIAGVRKVYRRGEERIDVLQGIDLAVPRGDFLALMGPSGSGKTTLLNLMGGLDRPSAGSVEVDGEPIHRLSDGQLAAWRQIEVSHVVGIESVETARFQPNFEGSHAGRFHRKDDSLGLPRFE